MASLYDLAAEHAQIPDNAREQVIERVRELPHDCAIPDLAELMHHAFIVEIIGEQRDSVAHLGRKSGGV